MLGKPFEKHDVVRTAIVGLGSRQASLLSSLRRLPKAKIAALCEIDSERADAGRSSLVADGHEPPDLYVGEDALQQLIEDRERYDLAIVATAWSDHAWIAVQLMNAGMHVAVEVPAAVTIEECWELVTTSERTQRHCVMLENCCYGEEELMMLNMVRAGVLGELVHADASYIHDIRNYLAEKSWRRIARTRRNGNLYPTHGLGPVANYLQINRGDRITTLASLSSAALGLQAYEAGTGQVSPDTYVCGDMNVSVLRTAKGRTIMLQHDEISPRPYNRHNVISGTKGYANGFENQVYLEDSLPVPGKPVEHAPGRLDAMASRYEHHFWTEKGEQARAGDHGGMDYIMLWRLIEAMVNGDAPDMDVYDAALLSSISPLTELSNGRLEFVDVPDFTRGRWDNSRVPFL
ncbi:putative dehydrogenase [Microbacterium natoriense]|uniref:Dehydrogenase n=1 Tax=Microbacterium natoriense TaxID=284570 RepID=A0AAW8ESW2_9MICO|nr:Gfo/Idh/MocA family oxidoreductase [Microbacterium natoriense]MDQ0646212.1 putative dehydrogenase [Microbacterium natoriense]